MPFGFPVYRKDSHSSSTMRSTDDGICPKKRCEMQVMRYPGASERRHWPELDEFVSRRVTEDVPQVQSFRDARSPAPLHLEGGEK